MENFNKEIWKDIPNYEGLYQASTFGRIRNSRTYKVLRLGNYIGYYRVDLCKDGKRSTKKVHRLVAETFIPNPDNLPCVNHKDCNPSNNAVSNLEWCTYSYNTNYADANEKRANNRKPNIIRPVYQYDLSGNLITKWDSTRTIETVMGFCHSSISKCCRGVTATSYGYVWKYE